MNRLLFRFSVCALALLAYVSSPFVTAWSIREAVRNGNSTYLQTAVDWPLVRETLTPSLVQLAASAPNSSGATASAPMRSGLWQRFKAYVAQKAIFGAGDSAISAEGLPRLFAARRAYRNYMSPGSDESQLPALTRIQASLSRIKRAEFISLTHVEVDMTDRMEPTRMIHARLDLRPTGWVLTGLRLSSVAPPTATPQPLLTASRTDEDDLAPVSAAYVDTGRELRDDRLDGGAPSFRAEANQPTGGMWARLKAAAQPR